MKPYGIRRNWNDEEWLVFKSPTRKSARRHANNKKFANRRARRTVKNSRGSWKEDTQ